MSVNIKRTGKAEVLEPDYYKLSSGRMVRDVVRELGLDWVAGTAVVYIARAGRKIPTVEGKIEDYEKAIETLADEVRALRAEIKSKAISAGRRRAKKTRERKAKTENAVTNNEGDEEKGQTDE